MFVCVGGCGGGGEGSKQFFNACAHAVFTLYDCKLFVC